jgi:hypothetical protein
MIFVTFKLLRCYKINLKRNRNNQFKVCIIINLSYTTHGSNHLISGDQKCSKMFLNFKFSLFSRFKVHTFNNKKVEIS